MSPEVIGGIGLVVMLVLILLRMWIGIAMLLVGFVGYWVLRGYEPAAGVVVTIGFGQATMYTLTTVPLFIFMGQIIFSADIGRDLYNAAYRWMGHLRGGLVLATVPACAMFGAITGVPTPAAITLGKVALPEMRKYGYTESFSTGPIASAATMAMLIPPSIPMIVYGILTETNISQLFMAGILPGVLLSILFLITISIMVRVKPEIGPAGPRSTWRVRFSSLTLVWPVIILFILVIGGIYSGAVTPTEAGGLGAFVAIIIALVMRRLTVRKFSEALLEATGLTAMILLLIIGAQIFGRFLAVSGLPKLLAETLVGMDLPNWGIFLILIALYVILGMILDVMSAVIITMPVIFPAIVAMGYDPFWFGVIMMLVVQMGVITPPIGMDVFVLSGAIDVPAVTIFRGVAPFVITILICILILMIFPEIATVIPLTM
jgi:tripartite ATP-independent transporter DctM subunit